MASSSSGPQHGEEAAFIKVPIETFNLVLENLTDLQPIIKIGTWEKEKKKRDAKRLCRDSVHHLQMINRLFGGSDQAESDQPPPPLSSQPAQGSPRRRAPALSIRSPGAAYEDPAPKRQRLLGSFTLDKNKTTRVARKGKGKGKVIYVHQHPVCNWRKYGTKTIKSSNNNTRCYYKCSVCFTKIQVENDMVIDIKYTGNGVCPAPGAAVAADVAGISSQAPDAAVAADVAGTSSQAPNAVVAADVAGTSSQAPTQMYNEGYYWDDKLPQPVDMLNYFTYEEE